MLIHHNTSLLDIENIQDIVKRQKKWRCVSMRLIKPMKVCKICFKNFHDDSLSHLLNSRLNICKHCMKEIRAKFIKFDIDGIKALSIYDYDEKTHLVIQYRNNL